MSIKVKVSGLQEMHDIIIKVGQANLLTTKVGVLSNRAHRVNKSGSEGVDNVELGAKHEFGDRVPARSFLGMPLTQYLDENTIPKTIREVQHVLRGNSNMRRAAEMLGKDGERVVDEAFKSGGFGNWAPDAPSTIENKGHGTILVETQQLMNSVSSKVE
jgi:hypothetical protein